MTIVKYKHKTCPHCNAIDSYRPAKDYIGGRGYRCVNCKACLVTGKLLKGIL
jgi:hypothetical protein